MALQYLCHLLCFPIQLQSYLLYLLLSSSASFIPILPKFPPDPIQIPLFFLPLVNFLHLPIRQQKKKTPKQSYFVSKTAEQAERVNDNHQNLPMNGNDREVIALLENQIQDLKAQLTQASDRENTLVGEKSKLLDMLSAEQEKTRLLMLPAPKKNASWWGYFRLKR